MPYADPEKARAYAREWRRKNRHRFKESDGERNRRFEENNPGYKRAYMRRWRAENPERHLHNVVKRKYGISGKEYQGLLDRQGGVCAICRNAEQHQNHQRLSVDHCHTTGEVRGLLCHRCNVAIGSLRNDPLIMRAAAEYIETNNGGN